MSFATVIIAVFFVVALAALTVAFGWWRILFGLFRLNAKHMTVKRLGLLIPDEDVGRIEGIFESFAGGFNAMIAGPSDTAWERFSDSQPSFNEPFSHEGAAMGYTLRRMFRYDAAGFEKVLVSRRPEFRYLYYVGLGFWWGMRNVPPRRVMELVEGLDPLHRYLCFDGYGFKHAFFDHPKDAAALARLDELPGYARNAAFHGVGRAFWFRFMAEPKRLIEQMEKLGDHAIDAAAGVGLASVFVNPDRLDTAQALAERMPSQWHPHVHLGMCFGLKARSLNDPQQFARDLACVDESVRVAVSASIRQCDRVEQAVRGDGRPDGYRRWRERVTAWMETNVEYPMKGLGTPQERSRLAVESMAALSV